MTLDAVSLVSRSHPLVPASPRAALEALRARAAEHPFWSTPLLAACRAGHLTREDFRFIFSQYYLYSRNFTRYLTGLMTNCEDDLLRSQLGQNVWEESGGIEVDKRHAEIFRRFLTRGLDLDVSSIEFVACAEWFVREYLEFTRRAAPAESSAFLSLGTEGIVPRLYSLFLEGLTKAGVAEEHLEFFRIHIACDDEHARTLESIVLSYASQPDWYGLCERGLTYALDLRQQFFERLYQELQQQRLTGLVERIQARKSLTPEDCTPEALRFRDDGGKTQGETLYQNVNERLNIDFSVTRIPFPAEVLDPRVVRIPPGRNNENHKHAHETIFVVLQGTGEVTVDGRKVEVQPGDLVFVPRWCFHQSRNTGPGELVLLAVADFGLTGKAFIGDYLKTARLKQVPATEGTVENLSRWTEG